jgi:5-dehydro-2-deoxygluconokinase
MNAVLDGIRKNKFVVFGRAGMDMYATPVGVKSEHADTFHADLGGSSANICAGLCKFGAEAALVTSVSDDAIGRFCVNRLQHYGVDTRYVRAVGGEARTSLAVYESTIEDFQNVIYRNGAADFQVTDHDMDQVAYTDYGALITAGNDEEFGFMAGGMDMGLDKARALADTGRIVIYKMGSEGAITFAGGEEFRTGIYPVTAVKPNGAGDSFMAGLLAGLADGRDMKEAVLRGSACAAIVVSKPGCAPAMPTTEQLEQFLSSHPGPTDV